MQEINGQSRVPLAVLRPASITALSNLHCTVSDPPSGLSCISNSSVMTDTIQQAASFTCLPLAVFWTTINLSVSPLCRPPDYPASIDGVLQSLNNPRLITAQLLSQQRPSRWLWRQQAASLTSRRFYQRINDDQATHIWLINNSFQITKAICKNSQIDHIRNFMFGFNNTITLVRALRTHSHRIGNKQPV